MLTGQTSSSCLHQNMPTQSSSSCHGQYSCHQIRKKRNDAIFDVAVQVIVCHPSLLVHPNRRRKDPLLFKTKPPVHALDMHQKINLDPLSFCISCTRRELPVRWHAFRHRVATNTKNPSACQQQLGNDRFADRRFALVLIPSSKISISPTLMIHQSIPLSKTSLSTATAMAVAVAAPVAAVAAVVAVVAVVAAAAAAMTTVRQ
jgi:hypothetical protein